MSGYGFTPNLNSKPVGPSQSHGSPNTNASAESPPAHSGTNIERHRGATGAEASVRKRIEQSHGETAVFNACHKAGFRLSNAIGLVFNDDSLKSIEKLGKGRTCTVYTARYQLPDNSMCERVFKPGNPEKLDDLAHNVAMSRLDKFLGWNIVADTQFAVTKGRLGIAMAFCAGSSVRKTMVEKEITGLMIGQEILENKHPPTEHGGMNPYLLQCGITSVRFVGSHVIAEYGQADTKLTNHVAKKKLTQLQFLHALGAQRDSHREQYNVVKNPVTQEVIDIKAFDHDDGFNKYFDACSYGGHRVGPPLIIDREMYSQIMQLENHHMNALFGDILRPDVIEATHERLHDLKTHVAKLAPENVIDTNNWDNAHFYDPRTSYIARDGGPF